MAERLFTTYQIAELLQTTPSTVVEWMEKGWLPFRRMPDGPVRIAERQLIEFLKNQGIDLAQILAKIAGGDNGDSAGEGEYVSEQSGSEQYEDRRAIALPTSEPEPTAPDPTAEKEQPVESEQPASREAQADEPTPEQTPEPQVQDEPVEQPVADVEPHTAPAEPSQAQQPPAEVAEVPRAPDALVESILRDALECGSEYVHLEPAGQGYRVRLRLGRKIIDRRRYADRLSGDEGREFVEHVKALSGAATGDGERPVRGCFARAVNGRGLEVAVSSCPVVGGEKLLLQVASPAPGVMLAGLGLSEADLSRLRAAAASPGSLVLVTAPPRSGRRTTLRALATERGQGGRIVMGVEQSSWAPPAGVLQVPTGEGHAFFGEAVRAAAGMDCDVLMIEDLSEPSVAQAAVEATRGGATVLVGMRASGAAEALGELTAMGAGGWELSRALRCVVVQRSVATLCDACKREVTVADEQLMSIGLGTDSAGFAAYAPVGCSHCDEAGYAGRTAIFAVVEPTETLRLAIRSNADADIMRGSLGADVRELLATAAAEKLRSGATCLREVAEALGQ